ncbi:uncharacterized protein OCT59_024056 [Rhizophagus irregularis]|uniref:uncharacterized protein n=1 Tax=Rhizophagus irregularis TaxID=588596 RepID=UPI0033328B2E|nr:hypothetical protein OCT59_024056 [Rhizophagus irregularis]
MSNLLNYFVKRINSFIVNYDIFDTIDEKKLEGRFELQYNSERSFAPENSFLRTSSTITLILQIERTLQNDAQLNSGGFDVGVERKISFLYKIFLDSLGKQETNVIILHSLEKRE